jgi:hypothetical protein
MIVLEFITMLTEGARTPHPEDFIFAGSTAALDAIAGMISAVKQPETVTIKWDGSPAIIFGRRVADGRFTMNYKEYIGEPGGQVTSAEELLKFYQGHGKNMEVGEKLASVFNAVGSICPAGFAGFVQGDLMWSEPLEPVGGKFVFRPNPHGVTYGVDAKSDLGKSIAGRAVGLAVHSYGTDIEKSKSSPLVGRQTLQGLGGLAGTNQYITVFTGNMGNTFKMAEPTAAKKAAERAVAKFVAAGGDAFLSSLTQSSKDRLQQYYNRKATGQQVDGAWIQSKLTRPQFEIVNAEENKTILEELHKVYMAVTQLKLAILTQLDSQVPDIEQSVGGQPKGEGFNIDTASGFIKLVDRSAFSTANAQGRL